MQNVVKPYKAALVDYQNGTVIQVHPGLLSYERKLRVQEGFLQLGFIPGEFKSTFIRQPLEAERLLQRKRAQRKKRKPNPCDAMSQHRLDAQALRLASNLSVSQVTDTPLWDEEQFETATYTGSEWSSQHDGQVADLETKIVELTRQIRLLKEQQGDLSQPNPTPIILGSHIVVPTEGGDVLLELSYLDPDRSPYYVHCDGAGQLLPCVVLGGRYISFKAPAHSRGCVALTVMCEHPPGTLQRYCRPIWLEYKTAGELKAESNPEAAGPTSPPPVPTPQRRGGRPALHGMLETPSPHPALSLSPSMAVRGPVRRGHVNRRAQDLVLRSHDEGPSPRGSPAPPTPLPVQASPGNRCVSWRPAPDEEDISTEGSTSYVWAKSFEPEIDGYFGSLEDVDVFPETTSTYSKRTSYSSGSEAGKSEGEANDDADSLSRGQGSTISNPSVCSRCTSVSRASSLQRARVMESLRSLTLNYAAGAGAPVPALEFAAAPPKAGPAVPGGAAVVRLLPSPAQAPPVASPAAAAAPPAAVDDSRIPLTRNVLEWHNEETGGLPHLKPSAGHPWQADGDQSSSSAPSVGSSSLLPPSALLGLHLGPAGPTLPLAFPFGLPTPFSHLTGTPAGPSLFAPLPAWPSLLPPYTAHPGPLPPGPTAGLALLTGLAGPPPPAGVCVPNPTDRLFRQTPKPTTSQPPQPIPFLSADRPPVPHSGAFT
eukprot:EG_transcript_4043